MVKYLTANYICLFQIDLLQLILIRVIGVKRWRQRDQQCVPVAVEVALQHNDVVV